MKNRSVLRTVAAVLRPVMRLLLMTFYDRKYLTGRHFEKGLGGYVWGFRSAWARNILRLGPPMPWPMSLTCVVSNPENVQFHPDDLNNFQSLGTYFQNFSAKIVLGRGVYIAPNVGLITANHNFEDLDSHEPGEDIVIGDGCWIGMGAVILPGVRLGPRTIVAAGAIVTSSFPQGRVVIGGVPAKVIKNLENSDKIGE